MRDRMRMETRRPRGARRGRVRPRPGWVSLAAGLGLYISGCNVDVHDGLGPIVPVPDVEGVVLRNGQPVDDLGVTLRDPETGVETDSTNTDIEGRFWFAGVPPGLWEVKISGEEPEDFDSITLEFAVSDPESLVTLGTMDIYRYGAHVLEPGDSARLPKPNPFRPVSFRWTLPDRGVDWARVQISDAEGRGVWSSPKEPTSEVIWNGLGDEGEYDGVLVPAGIYSWRVKIGFENEVEARLDPQELILE